MFLSPLLKSDYRFSVAFGNIFCKRILYANPSRSGSVAKAFGTTGFVSQYANVYNQEKLKTQDVKDQGEYRILRKELRKLSSKTYMPPRYIFLSAAVSFTLAPFKEKAKKSPKEYPQSII